MTVRHNKDRGKEPYVVDIESKTVNNDNFRTTLWTGAHLQLTLMSIPVGGDIGLEVHPKNDQFLRLEKGNPWVYGFLANNVWSVGSGAGAAYNNFLLQPFLNYNFRGGTYLTTSPIVTANWKADGQQWTVPIGGGIGHIFRLDKLPVNAQVGAYYNVVRPDLGPNWQVRAQVQLMFPK